MRCGGNLFVNAIEYSNCALTDSCGLGCSAALNSSIAERVVVLAVVFAVVLAVRDGLIANKLIGNSD
jgi:hypothetical protein